tara:strand:+ start:32 stop:808 length:777 start_codon:yes stop_codon:yes gene_type:complete
MNIQKNLKNLIKHPYLSLKLINKSIINFIFENLAKKKAKNFFENKNFIKYFIKGHENEIISDFIDLKNLYSLIRKRKPKCVIEFGSGFSTIAICLALKDNQTEDNILGRLFSIDGNQEWIKNTENKVDDDLKKFVTFHYSKSKITNYNGQIASLHESLPDVSPNFIYLDGPSPLDVGGDINGISFNSKNLETQNIRRIVAADVLLYESTAPADFFVLLDRRYTNANFLEKNLIYKYNVRKKLYFGGFVSFEKKYQPYP